jgi:Flp pilus assembly pilin Flp
MRGLWVALTGRFEAGDSDRAGIVEYAMMIALVAVVVTAAALLVLSQFIGW